ncbi:predicted protein [Sclerotinia sclerotiorum 1980 UF-70]|uniref:Uncharacterized protein n=1 Tax=Sclerotinia sclerotiorum (strain ATCC 18683 / 1980 / Ss-1) TaxID=665079 RepID=A7EIB1_SCLS1|nr:predicted protein [Sclerotinia sclerotiorum 1980 UF-70]EDO02577.1 predicted protein [Sclerotinia sclerotiorum 1980 UF-70]
MTSIPLHLEGLDDYKPWDIGVHLFNVFNDLIQPTASQISPREAAEKINMLYPDKEKEGGLYREETASFFLELDDMHVKLASQVPYQRPEMNRLVELFFEIRKLPLFIGSGLVQPRLRSGPVKYDVRAITLRKDQNEKRFKFRNLSSFLARLAKAGFEDSNMLYALTALQDALEYEFEASNASHVLSSDYLVPIAAEWIIMAGELMPLNGGNMGGDREKEAAERMRCIEEQKSKVENNQTVSAMDS